jgi:hypothetical protein
MTHTLHFGCTDLPFAAILDMFKDTLCLTDPNEDLQTCVTTSTPEDVTLACYAVFGDDTPVCVTYDDDILFFIPQEVPRCPQCGGDADCCDPLCQSANQPSYNPDDEV